MSDGGVKTGEKIMRSPLSGTWYLVTKWRDKGDGKVQALEKEEIPEEDVSDVVRRLEEKDE